MKKDIHPQYHENSKVSCACGHAFVTGSTQAEIKTELCSHCHPFYTGKQKLVDTARRVEKFQGRLKRHAEGAAKLGKTAKRAAKDQVRKSRPVTVKAQNLDDLKIEARAKKAKAKK